MEIEDGTGPSSPSRQLRFSLHRDIARKIWYGNYYKVKNG